MKKKIKKIVSFGLALVTGFSLFGQTKVNAEEVVRYSNASPNFIYTTSEELGLPSTLDIDFTSEGDFTQDSFTLNGFTYAVNSDGSLGTITLPDNPETYESIMMVQSIGNKMFSGNAQYNDIDFSKFTNVKNVVLDMTPSMSLAYYMSNMPKVENLYVLADQNPPLTFNSSTLKNVILCRSLPVRDGGDWSYNSNFNLQRYPKGVKFVTIEGFKYVNGKYIESYRNNPNYNGTEDLNCYVIANEELPIPAESMVGNSYMQNGGIYYTYSRSNLEMHQPQLSAVYIDPAVKKVIIDIPHLSIYMRTGFGDFNKLDTIYVGEGMTADSWSFLRATNIYLPLPETFLYSDYTNFENVYFYETETATTLSITNAGIPTDQEVVVTFNVPETTELTIDSTNEMIQSKVVKYSGEYTPVVEIEIEGKTKSTENAEVIMDEFKAELLAEIESEKENTPNDETVNGSDTNTDDDKSFKDVIEETKEKIKESKPLQIVTGTLSIALAGLLAYAIYLLTRKVIRWARN